jgi:hypothetical protein
MTRTFESKTAKREKTPLLVGLIGPSGTGKTYSALRLAAGFQRVTGGETFVIDTEARRALHYAEKFNFQHVPFGAPFNPASYLDAINYCVSKGASTVIVDSMSHEHEGPGGVLEMHQQLVDKMSKGDYQKAERVKMLAWAKPKAERRRLINSIMQIANCNFIFCWRAKEKLKIIKGGEPEPLGFQPIAGEEFVYEMTLKCLLLPGANGAPTWQSMMPGEKLMMKLPEQFRQTFDKSPQLDENVGEALARWADGSPAAAVTGEQLPTADEIMASYAACSDPATWRELEKVRAKIWKTLTTENKARVKNCSEESDRRISAANEDIGDDYDDDLSESA